MQCTAEIKTGDDLDESDAAPLGDLVHVAVVRHLLDGGVLLHEPVGGVEDYLSICQGSWRCKDRWHNNGTLGHNSTTTKSRTG